MHAVDRTLDSRAEVLRRVEPHGASIGIAIAALAIAWTFAWVTRRTRAE